MGLTFVQKWDNMINGFPFIINAFMCRVESNEMYLSKIQKGFLNVLHERSVFEAFTRIIAK